MVNTGSADLHFQRLLPPQYAKLVTVDRFGRVIISKNGRLFMGDQPSSFAVCRRITITKLDGEIVWLEVFGNHWAGWPLQRVEDRYVVNGPDWPSYLI